MVMDASSVTLYMPIQLIIRSSMAHYFSRRGKKSPNKINIVTSVDIEASIAAYRD